MLKRFAAEIERNKLLEPNQTYVIAVSGGLDSVVLLDMLSRLSEDWGWQLVVAHLDHAQRADSYRDAAFVGALADAAGHKFRVHRLQGQVASNESSLRSARHAWLQQILNQVDGEGIVTAHHKNDRMETAVWHAIRGADRHGLTSLQSQSSARKLVRPLIGFSRGEILHYALRRGLSWHEDSTNTNPAYTRNLIRHHMLHVAPQVDPYYHSHFSDWLNHLESVNTRLDHNLELLLRQLGSASENGWDMYIDRLRDLSPSIRLAVIEHMARRLASGRGLTQNNLRTANKWIKTASTGSYSDAIPGLLLVREYDRVSFVPRLQPVEVEFNPETQALIENQPLKFGRFRLTLMPAEAHKTETSFISPGIYFVRRWEPGDRIKPVGMTGTKKVQDIFVDRKIPRRDRLNWPLIVSSTNEIALIPGLARDRRYASTPDPLARALQVEEIHS